MKIRDTLKRKNRDLEQDLEHIVALAGRAHIVPELEPYRIAFLARTQQLLALSRANLAWLQSGQDSLLPDVLTKRPRYCSMSA